MGVPKGAPALHLRSAVASVSSSSLPPSVEEGGLVVDCCVCPFLPLMRMDSDAREASSRGRVVKHLTAHVSRDDGAGLLPLPSRLKISFERSPLFP